MHAFQLEEATAPMPTPTNTMDTLPTRKAGRRDSTGSTNNRKGSGGLEVKKACKHSSRKRNQPRGTTPTFIRIKTKARHSSTSWAGNQDCKAPGAVEERRQRAHPLDWHMHQQMPPSPPSAAGLAAFWGPPQQVSPACLHSGTQIVTRHSSNT